MSVFNMSLENNIKDLDNNIKEKLEYIDVYAKSKIGKVSPGAQISVIKDGKNIFSKGYGLANINQEIPVDTNTSFNYGSISKLFIWIAAMQLKEQNKLDLNKDIREYLPENYELHINSEEPVTFLNLMNHNAGFESYWKYHDGTGESCDFDSTGEAVKNCYSGIQCFEPGRFVGYSNYGANLAAYIIENITEMPFFEYVQKNIFDKCDMKCCYPEKNPNSEVMSQKALGYTHSNPGDFQKTSCYTGDWLYASGSVVGTADDLMKFAQELMPSENQESKLFINKNTLKELLEISYSSTGEELFSIHHGFWGSNGNRKGLGHTGLVNGMNSNFVIVPEENLAISVLANDQNAYDLTYNIINLITGTDYDEIEDKTDFPDSEILEGEYVCAREQLTNRKTPFNTYKINKIDKNTISITFNNYTQEYVQIRPYVYENITAKSGQYYKQKIYFKVEKNNNIEQVTKGVFDKNDFIPLRTIINESLTRSKPVPGLRTIKNLLKTGLEPIEKALYVWGGGWFPHKDSEDNITSHGSNKIGVHKEWKEFYDSQDSGYQWSDWDFNTSTGLDCSGYVGWVVYNTLHNEENLEGYTRRSTEMAKNFADRDFGTYITYDQVKDFKAGDIMSGETDRHVYICLGQCEDKSVVFLHSSHQGVHICGTVTPDNNQDSQAYNLAKKYMKKYYNNFYSRYKTCKRNRGSDEEFSQYIRELDYLTEFNQMRWNILDDPDNYRNMSAEEILQDLFEETQPED